MKFLITADLHIHSHQNNKIFIDVAVDYLNYISNYCIENNIDYIIIAGDLFHISSKINTENFIPIFKTFEKINEKTKIIMIPGNHDILSEHNKTILSVFDSFADVYEKFTEIKINNTKFYFLPFKRNTIPDIKIEKEECNQILITHLDIANFKLNSKMLSRGIKNRVFFNQFDWVFSGHFHIHQSQDNIIYIGSPYQQNFGEVGEEKGFIVYDDNTNKWNRKIYKNAPVFKILTPRQSIDKSIDNCFVKLIIDEKIDNLSKLREILYDKGAIDIIQEFKINDEVVNDINSIKIDNNGSVINMIKEFINQDKKIKSIGLNVEKLFKLLDNLEIK